MGRDFKTTAEAYEKFAKALQELEASKRLFETAGEPLPEKLKEFFGLHRNGSSVAPLVTVTPLPRNHRPLEAENDWISVPLDEATATTLVLAVLKRAGKPLPAKEVVEAVGELNPNITRGSIHNIGTRLDKKLIAREENGWVLIDPRKATIIDDGYLWGPRDVFDKQDLAAHRREAILHILGILPGGLQTVQIVEMLRRTEWVHAPASKDLVKADMEQLEADNKVKRMGNSRKWCSMTEG
jgi:hypothetical protein